MKNDVKRSLHAWQLFRDCFAPWSGLARQGVFSTKKNIVKEKNNNRKRNVCTERGMGGERETTRRERSGAGEEWYPISSDIRGGGVGNLRRKWSKRNVRSGGCSLSPRIVRRCRCFFTIPVPRSPFSELHAPNPTSDPHKGRRGRNTFGKSSSTPLQRIRRVSQKSLVPRYVYFSDSLGGEGAAQPAHAEWETDSFSVTYIACDT